MFSGNRINPPGAGEAGVGLEAPCASELRRPSDRIRQPGYWLLCIVFPYSRTRGIFFFFFHPGHPAPGGGRVGVESSFAEGWGRAGPGPSSGPNVWPHHTHLTRPIMQGPRSARIHGNWIEWTRTTVLGAVRPLRAMQSAAREGGQATFRVPGISLKKGLTQEPKNVNSPGVTVINSESVCSGLQSNNEPPEPG